MFQVEEEQDPEERDQFLQQLYKFMEDRGQPHVCDHSTPHLSLVLCWTRPHVSSC